MTADSTTVMASRPELRNYEIRPPRSKEIQKLDNGSEMCWGGLIPYWQPHQAAAAHLKPI